MDLEQAKQKAVSFIGISKKTENEVRIKLERLDVSYENIDLIINDLTELGYINDEEYVDAYIRQCKRLQKYSIYEIKQRLLQKGIKKDIIESKLENNLDDEYEIQIVSSIIKSKSKVLDELKLKNYLYRRGFKNINIEE